jgi:hypothetical protein
MPVQRLALQQEQLQPANSHLYPARLLMRLPQLQPVLRLPLVPLLIPTILPRSMKHTELTGKFLLVFPSTRH